MIMDIQTTVEKKILMKISKLESEIEEIEKVRKQIALGGTSSASLGSSGGSKSYTRLSLSELTTLIDKLKRDLDGYRRLLNGNSGSPFKTTFFIYS